VVVLPSAFTLGNLFFGMWAIVSAAQGNFLWAGWFIVFAGVLDMLDGRVARLSGTGTRFGAELDSLVDLTSFGVAPALVMYHLEFAGVGRFGWVLCFLYVVAAAVRLARFNVAALTKPPTTGGWFRGLPSPSAGMTLAVYYPFTQTEVYHESLRYLQFNQQGLAFLMLVLGALMVSSILAGALLAPREFLFPLGLAYAAYGVIRAAILGWLERHDDDEPAPEIPA
jgi:CDP-diacylglycerol--serine O-phosphatidyltransferase